MGAWSGEPFGNDTASDWAWELDGQDVWDVVEEAIAEVLEADEAIDADIAAIAIAAAEVVAHGLGRPTQSDAYTESVESFVGRAGRPSPLLVKAAERAVSAASSADGELAELWAEDAPQDWHDANARLLAALAD